jgi:hypothetical protein
LTVQLRHTAQTLGAFSRWAKRASAGEWCVYHVGRLAIDRRGNPDLDRLAATVAILTTTRWVNAAQYQDASGETSIYTYYAMRTTEGYAPRHLLNGDVTAEQWRALQAVLNRPLHLSAIRAIRDDGVPNETRAIRLMSDMLKVGLLDDHPSRGVHVSNLGLAMMT